MPGLGGRALVGELTVDDVGSGELVDRVLGRILRDGDGPTRPIGHAPEDRSHVLHHLVGLLAGLQVQVAGEAGLAPTQAIGHEFVTVTGHPVQRPLVNLRLRDEMPQAIAGVGDQVVKTPSRVVRPGHLEGAVPDTRVCARLRVVIGRHPHTQEFELIAAPGDGVELRGVHPQGHQGAVGVAQLALDDLGVRVQKGLVLQAALGRVLGQPAKADIPRTCAGQWHVVAALVARSGLARDRVGEHLNKTSACRLQVDRIAHRCAVQVAVGRVLQGERGHAHFEAHSVHVGVGDGAHHRLGKLAFHADRDFVLY